MPESIVKKYYDSLKEKKLIGAKCNKCGQHTCPPTLLCAECGSDDIAVVQMSGKGSLLFVSHGMSPPPNPRFEAIAPYAYGQVRMEEGCYMHAIISNISIVPEVLNEYYEKGPVDVELDIGQLDDLPYVAFKVI